MIPAALARFVLPALLLAAITALLWMSAEFAAIYGLFGSAALSAAFRTAAIVSTAVLVVFVVASFVVNLGLAWWLRAQPTHLQRGLTVAVLTFVAAVITLHLTGMDLSAIITTSALVTAIVGLSAQPMLTSLISGVFVNEMVRVGDAFVLDGEPVEVTSLDWRAVVARRPNGSEVIVPNARLAETTVQVLAHDRPLRVDLKIEVPSQVPPHRVRAIVNGVVDDCAELDRTRPVRVSPLAYDPGRNHSGYRAEFWVTSFARASSMEGRVLRRCWYAFQREGIAVPEKVRDPRGEDRRKYLPLLQTAWAARGSAASLPAGGVEALAATALEILYDDGERIVIPQHAHGRWFVLVEGTVTATTAPAASSHAIARNPDTAGPERTRTEWLTLMRHALAQRIGPYAGYAVHEAAAAGGSLQAIRSALACEIDDANDRAAFLAAIRPPEDRLSGPGHSFSCVHDALHRLVADPTLRAVDHALILALPESA